jgi:hypothetical protein
MAAVEGFMTEQQLRVDIVEVGRRMYARGYTASNDGNISVRLDDHRLLMTPKSVCKGFMSPEMMCITDLDGRKLAGERDPSSEMQMHLEVYRQRPDIRAVVHAHPPIATGFAVAGIPLDRAVLAEVVTTLGSVPIAEYATPSTLELPAANDSCPVKRCSGCRDFVEAMGSHLPRRSVPSRPRRQTAWTVRSYKRRPLSDGVWCPTLRVEFG